jgi:hypothetical protein
MTRLILGQGMTQSLVDSAMIRSLVAMVLTAFGSMTQ